MDVYLLKPVDMAQASGKLFYESNNRGLKLATGVIDTVDRLFLSNDPTTPADAGDGFLMRQGYVIAWSGWDVTVASGPGALTITVPVATNADGSPDRRTVARGVRRRRDHGRRTACPIPPRRLDTSAATLSVRVHYADPPVTIPPERLGVRRQPDRPPAAGGYARSSRDSLYDLAYPAQDPLVAGLAFAATRDFVAFLRHAAADDAGTPNPVAGRSAIRIRLRPLAAGALPARLRPSRLQRGRERQRGLRRAARLPRPARAADRSTIASRSPAAPSASTAIACIRRSASRSPGASRPIP